MTVRINLLPHREQKRAARQKQFLVLGVVVLAIGAGVVLAGHTFYAGLISNQESRNSYLKAEIAKLDKEIDEIKALKEKTNALLERKKVVETLQADRSQVVHLLDQLGRLLPDGVYLRSISQNGREVTLTGFAQSNARIATLMRNLDASAWLTKSDLVESNARILKRETDGSFKPVDPSSDEGRKLFSEGSPRVNEFSLKVSLVSGEKEKAGENAKPGATPATQPAVPKAADSKDKKA